MEDGGEYSTKIGWREKIRLLLEGAGTIVGVPVSEPARPKIILGVTTRADLESDSDIVIPSHGASLFSEVDPQAFEEMQNEINKETKGSGTSK